MLCFDVSLIKSQTCHTSVGTKWPRLFCKIDYGVDSSDIQIIVIDLFSKFIYSEKATKFCKIFPLLLPYVVPSQK